MSKGEPLYSPLNTRDDKEKESNGAPNHKPNENTQSSNEDESDSGNELFWYTNLLYDTIKQFLSGVIVIKSTYLFIPSF